MTRRSNRVCAGPRGSRLAKQRVVNYNRVVIEKPRRVSQRLVFSVVIAFSGVSASASCNKKPAANSDELRENRNLIQAIDTAEGETPAASSASTAGGGKSDPGSASAAPAEPVNQEPIEGVDVSALDDAKKERFYRFIDRELQSPCGKPHSLRTSLTSDAECKRAWFAAHYVIALLEDEATDKNVREFYDGHYKKTEIRSFKVDGVPFSGSRDGAVELVEFYDYGCPACKEFAPILQEVLDENSKGVVLYYKQFPLPRHPNSRLAAQAAIAALRQGKFSEMHKLLFDKPDRHQKSDLLATAQSLGLNVTRFEADFQAAASVVQADIDEGDAAGVSGTPTLFIDGREYRGPMHPRYLQLWIDEELGLESKTR